MKRLVRIAAVVLLVLLGTVAGFPGSETLDVAFNSTNSLTVTLNATTTIATVSSAPFTTEDDQTTTKYSIADTQLFWYSPPINVSYSSLSTDFQIDFANSSRFTNFSQLGPQLYIVQDLLTPPFYIIFGGNGSFEFSCSEAVKIGPGAFSCNYRNSMEALLSVQAASVTATGTSLSANLNSTMVDQNTQNTVTSLLAQRAFDLSSTLYVMTNEILPNNTGRRDVAWKIVGAETACAIFAMGNHMLFTSFLLAWAFPIFSGCASSRTDRLPAHTGTDTLFWSIILFVVIVACCIPGGLPAWALLAILFALIEAVLIGVYCVYRCVARRNGDDAYELKDMSQDRMYTDDDGRVLWSVRPAKMGHAQIVGVSVNAGLIVMWLIVMVVIVATWGSGTYYVFDRENGVQAEEIQPVSVAKSTLAIYSVMGAATLVKVNFFLQVFTDYCGPAYAANLTDAEKTVYIYYDYIVVYNIDMSIFEYPSYLDYSSVNNWFIRKLKPGSRPIAGPTDNTIITSAADARCLVFNSIPNDFQILVKEEQFDIPTLVQNATIGNLFTGGQMAIFRLAPQDYHRFHTPVSGTVTYVSDTIAGTIFSVNAEAVNSDNEVYYNKRQIILIETADASTVALVVVGATCVGSLVLEVAVGATVTKGEEIGYFQFGGSTVLLLFQADTVVFDADLLFATQNHVETFIKMGSQIAVTVQ